MKLKDLNSVPTPDVKELADKYGVQQSEVEAAVVKGTKVELEHTKDKKVAREIAMDHIGEMLDYYDRLDKMEKPRDSE
jgi:hypothetical protein